MNYYNEIDPFAAAWLRELMKAGEIPEGEVDERDIRDVLPGDLRGYKQCHFFAGIGGWPYALRLAGWPDDRPVWTGSCPCQPFSAAGQRKGTADERHLWPAWFHLISECRPSIIFGEQVAAAIRQGWWDAVQRDLEGEDYACGMAVLGAHSVGAPHIRQRLYFVGTLEYAASEQMGISRRAWEQGSAVIGVDNTAGSGTKRQQCGWEQRLQPEGSGIGIVADSTCQQFDGRGNAGTTGRCEPSDSSELGDASGNRSAARISRQEPGKEGYAGIAYDTGSQESFWDDCIWLSCRDGKSRPVESKLIAVSSRLSGDLGHLCASNSREEEKINGPSPQIRPIKILCALPKSADAKTVQRDVREHELFSSQKVLRSEMHGTGSSSSCCSKSKSFSDEGASKPETKVRDLCEEGNPCSPQRRKSFKQCREQFAKLVRLVPSSFALAELYGDTITKKTLQALFPSIHETQLMLYTPDQIQEVWESFAEKDQDRFRMAIENGELLKVSESPLIQKGKARVGRLRGYGNAIVPPLAAEFIKAYLIN